MKTRIYQVDAFAEKVFAGNPAAVCPLAAWLPDDVMKNIAMENNLSETAFYVRDGAGYAIRWFTPVAEVDLCGHATLAAAHVLLEHEGHSAGEIVFISRSGRLPVAKNGDRLNMDFPADTFSEVPLSPGLYSGLGAEPLKAFRGKTDVMLVLENEDQVRRLRPDFAALARVEARCVIATAKGSQADFVSRVFAPRVGVNEDPVTGSAHTTLAPYWAGVMGKTELRALQCSARGGKLSCRLDGGRVLIGGKARTYLVGDIFIP